MSRDYVAAITAMSACAEALAWLREAGHPGIGSAWRACERADWLLWLAARCEPVRSSAPWSDERRPLVLAACACAREALPVFAARSPGDDRPRRCVETTEAWCRGEATPGDVQVARRGARAAAVYAASAAPAAHAAAYAASAVSAVYASAASAADAAAYAARRDCHLRMCAAVRARLPVPVLP